MSDILQCKYTIFVAWLQKTLKKNHLTINWFSSSRSTKQQSKTKKGYAHPEAAKKVSCGDHIDQSKKEPTEETFLQTDAFFNTHFSSNFNFNSSSNFNPIPTQFQFQSFFHSHSLSLLLPVSFPSSPPQRFEGNQFPKKTILLKNNTTFGTIFFDDIFGREAVLQASPPQTSKATFKTNTAQKNAI